MITNLELKKAASELAFSTVTTTGPALDTAVATAAGELQLTDAQYNGFKQSVNNFRSQYAQAAALDAQDAARAAAQAKRAPAAPTPNS